MGITIRINDEVLQAATAHARRCGQALDEFIELAVRRELARQGQAQAQRALIPTFTRGTGLRPGADMTSTRALLKALDQGIPVEELR